MRKNITEKSACGVGFVASLEGKANHFILEHALKSLCCVEHRGAYSADLITGDGAGIMTDIPFELLGYEKGKIAVATLFFSTDLTKKRISTEIFERSLEFYGLKVLEYRDVPVDKSVLGQDALLSLPTILQVIIQRPSFCRTDESFDTLLYQAKQSALTQLRKYDIFDFFLPSLSANTIVYKALTRADALSSFYLDLINPLYKTTFSLFHRRFSTNTTTTWDKAQPFRLVGHNGEINTISGNRSWATAREKLMGIPDEELLTSKGISDSGTLNEIVEALRFRSSIPTLAEALAIMMPPAHIQNSFYKFWGRAMEPWDGPALVAFSDGQNIGARLDRNGFRPCRWTKTKEYFFLSSEAGSFEINDEDILQKGKLDAGSSVTVHLKTGKISFKDPSLSPQNINAYFDDRLYQLPTQKSNISSSENRFLDYELKKYLFNYTQEEIQKILIPIAKEGKEPVGSMGDTARLAIFSEEPRSFFDYFYHNFAQVTNPPLDYLREKVVIDLSVYLGKRPSIFAKKEFAPMPLAIELKSPLLTLNEMQNLYQLPTELNLKVDTIDITFDKKDGLKGFELALERIYKEALEKVTQNEVSILVLSDRKADFEKLPIPVLLALRTCKKAFHAGGVSLRVGMVVESAEIKNTHHLATCIGYGASAVCPYFALEMVYFEQDKELKSLLPEQMEKNIIKTFEAGLLKIMSKMGISVVRSYENSQLFTTIGLDFDLANTYFVRSTHYLSGICLPQIVDNIIEKSNFAQKQAEKKELWNAYIFKEHARGLQGEKHSMTASISKIIHQLARDKNYDLTNPDLYQSYLESNSSQNPIHIRHLFSLKISKNKHKNTEIQSLEAILATFGAGAMSFGAISAEAQRDILKAMQIIGGRSNSGEGGENPYYYSEGISATIKQVASGRFGVDALYLISSNEYQIKVAQGAKPGEGGQLMAVKVDAQIAKARHSLTHVDLISPPPLHDIYSIEDLKELIYQLKQINPYAKINVKLVAGAGIGTIAVGVAKAGADIIHISGSDGGTGAATLSSMKHAGIPWEFGLWEAHKALIDNKIRQNVMLRTDGGLHTGKDIIIAAILGADNFEFGKLLLIAQGCIMARICEKNTCPTGIATHNEKFKAKYQGNEWHIVKILKYLAKDIQTKLAFLGMNTLEELKGRTDLLEINTVHQNLIQNKNIQLDFILKELGYYLPKNDDLAIKDRENKNIFDEKLAQLNKKILQDTQKALEENKNIVLDYPIKNTDRAILATLAGKIAWKEHQKIIQKNTTLPTFTQKIEITFKGSAGQGFGAFMTKGMHIKLEGEANDSVAKSMSGGKMLIIPPKNTYFKAHENVIIGNCALYGAINGTLYVNGKAGDRFAVRNSGALAVVEGVGLHACEYMTRGKVIILGKTSYNVGSGMTGGELFLYQPNPATINQEYITEIEIDEAILEDLKNILLDYYHETKSIFCDEILKNWEIEKKLFKKYVPLKYLENIANQSDILVETSKKI